MGKRRKNDNELIRFVWKRNVQFDTLLLREVESRNPFAFNNSKQVWMEVAEFLRNCALKMKVTERSCRERVLELLRAFRRNERISRTASGVDEPEETNLQKLLEGVASLQDSGATVASRSVYRNKQRSEADSIRAAAAESFQSEVESEELDLGAPMSETNAPTSENKAPASENNAPMTANNVATMLNDRFRAMEQERSIKFFFSDNGDSDDVECENDDLSGRLNYHRKDKIGSSRRQNPKQDLVRYLKTEKECEIRKEELLLRKEELKIREKEAENKRKELEILLKKTKSDADNSRNITHLLMTLVNRQ